MLNRNRSFKRMNRLFWVFFSFVFVLIISIWGFVIFLGVSIAVNPEGAAHEIGRVGGAIVRGIEDGRQGN